MPEGSYPTTAPPPPPPPPPPPQGNTPAQPMQPQGVPGQPGLTQPPYAPPVEPPKKKSRKVWWFAGCGCLAVFVVVIVVIVVVAMVGAFGFSGSKTTVGEGGVASTKSGPGVITSDPKEKFKQFLDLLGEGKADSAYEGYTSAALRERGTKEEFAALIEGFPGLKDRQASSYVWKNEGEDFTVTGELTTSDGTYTYEAILVLVDGSWLVDSFGLERAP